MASKRPDTVDLGRLLATAVALFYETLARAAGMTAAESRCLSVVSREGTVTPGELARESGLTTGAITGIVDRLEKAGLVRREQNPADRRSVLVHAVPNAGPEAVLRPAYAALRSDMAALRDSFTLEEQCVINRYLESAAHILAVQTEALRALPPRRSRPTRPA